MKDILYPLRILHGKMHEWRVIVLPYCFMRLKHPNAVFLVLTPGHGNLGDHAIAQAEKQYLKYLGISYIEITDNKIEELKRLNSLKVLNHRAVLIHGGGFLGTLWINMEYLARAIIEHNQKSKIIFFPNTIFYEDNDFGKGEFEKSKRIFNTHKYLKLFAREKQSFITMKEAYKDVYLAPDMVLMMNQCKPNNNRHGCILCLRNDREKTRSEKEEQIIREQTQQIFQDDVVWLDMVCDHPIQIEQRDEELEKQYAAFRNAQLVVTDRLHGMIFSAITGTPCIVIDSKSPKVKGCYEWIRDLEYIHLCDDVSKIEELFNKLTYKEWQYDNSRLLPMFEPLKTELMKIVKRT